MNASTAATTTRGLAAGAPVGLTSAVYLSQRERCRKAQLEHRIREGLSSFMDVADALLEIQESQLYREDFKTFEAYCREKWNITPRRARQIVAGGAVVKNLSAPAVMGDLQLPLVPANERQTRPLQALPPQKQREVWKDAVQQAGGKQPTVRHVEAAARSHRAAQEPPAITLTKPDSYNKTELLDAAFRAIVCVRALQDLVGFDPVMKGHCNAAVMSIEAVENRVKSNAEGGAGAVGKEAPKREQQLTKPSAAEAFVIFRKSVDNQTFYLSPKGGWTLSRNDAEKFPTRTDALCRLRRRRGQIKQVKS